MADRNLQIRRGVGQGGGEDSHQTLRTTAVKCLNRYFCFLMLRFHLPVREKWAKMYKSVSQHNYLSIILNILSFFC